ncbi:MAG: diguanylate cyclase [Deltaproteobacteria bacterium]|nr:diguanylate cyclase [Deltaproteobacteria bacterium]
MDMPEILVVDDDAFFRTFCADVLRGLGYVVRTASTGKEALQKVAEGGASLVLADIYMPEGSGLELLETVKAQNPSVDVVIMTGYASVDTAIRALKQGAADYLRKPFAAEQLAAVVEGTVARRRLYQENVQLKGQLRLYEVSRTFSSVDNPARVLELGLDALLHAVGGTAGLCLFTDAALRFMTLLHDRGFAEGEAQGVREALVRRAQKTFHGLSRVECLGGARLAKALEGTAAASAREALVLPVRDRGAVAGAFVLLRDGARFTAEDIANAAFLGRQVDLSYDSARSLQDARDLAYVDALTDLYNGRYLDLVLDKRIAEADSLSTPFSMLFLDLDFFKEINDAHGHLTGGKVLIEVSRILQAKVRDEDTVIRYGGDEFTLVLPNTDAPGARDAAERVRQAIKEHVFLAREGKSIRLTASIGVATYPDDARSREELINQADRAMYRGKEASRDVVYAAGPQ